MNLTTSSKLTRVSNAVAAGTTAVNSASVDMQGFEACTFLVAFGAITTGAVTSLKVQQSGDDGVADSFADLTGTSITIADTDDNKIVAVEVHNPRERYVRCVVSRGTANAVIDGILAIQTGPKDEPTTHDAATVVGSEIHHAPAEGTA